jgi:hypothetical protein
MDSSDLPGQGQPQALKAAHLAEGIPLPRTQIDRLDAVPLILPSHDVLRLDSADRTEAPNRAEDHASRGRRGAGHGAGSARGTGNWTAFSGAESCKKVDFCQKVCQNDLARSGKPQVASGCSEPGSGR